MHMHRHHPAAAADEQLVDDFLGNDFELDCQTVDGDTLSRTDHISNVKAFNARFTLSLEAQHQLSQTALDTVVSSASVLVESHVNRFKQEVKKQLEELNIDSTICDNIPTETFLEDFSCHRKRQRYYSSNLDTLLLPHEVILGDKFVTVNGNVQKVSTKAYFVPLMENLKILLNMPDVWECIQASHQRANDDFMHDVGDGDFVNTHPIFSVDPNALQLILNCDDLEIVNPLGTHVKKNKVTVFYFTLANIPPNFRSKLHVIQLVAIAKTKDVRQNGAVERLLAEFVQTLVALSDGVDMQVLGWQRQVKGALVMVCADTLASNWIGGFKEGVSFALKNCRVCELENKATSSVFSETQECVHRRSLAVHKERCQWLLGLSKQARQYWSKLWGINGSSCLLEVPHFDLTACLVQDPMHVLLEGVALHGLSQALFHFIYVGRYFTLGWLNTCLKGFHYSYLHSHSKPAPIEKQHIDGTGSLKQTASGIMTLLQTLPFLIGTKIIEGDEHWINLLRLIQISVFSTSTYCSEDTVMYLKILVASYLHNFKKLYPMASFIPKMHYLTHFPSQMQLFGPLRHQWCMRFEGKNGFFSDRRYKNFKNLPFSLAKRHQLYMAHKQSGSTNGRNPNYVYEGDSVASGSIVNFPDVLPHLVHVMHQLAPGAGDEVYMTHSATIHGKEYRKGCCLVLDYVDGDEPIFAMLESVVVIDHVKYFIVAHMEAEFHLHILSYSLVPANRTDMLPFSRLKFKWPLSVYTHEGKDVVMNTNTHTYAYPF